MFRRYQNPTQQGTEVLPNAMQAPPVVRFEGVQPGSGRARELMARYYSYIAGFLRSQRQNQAAGGMLQTNVTRDFPEISVTYQRTFGQEIFTVRPRPGGNVKRSVVDDIMLDGHIVVEILPVLDCTAVVTLQINGVSVATMSATYEFAISGATTKVFAFYFGPDADRFTLDPQLNPANYYTDDNRPAWLSTKERMLVVLPRPPAPELGPFLGTDAYSNDWFDDGLFEHPYYPLSNKYGFETYYQGGAAEVYRLPLSVLNATGVNDVTLLRDSITADAEFAALEADVWLYAGFYSRHPSALRRVEKSWRYSASPALNLRANDRVVEYYIAYPGYSRFAQYPGGGEDNIKSASVTLDLSSSIPEGASNCSMALRETSE